MVFCVCLRDTECICVHLTANSRNYVSRKECFVGTVFDVSL
jgi:hypothetical protein